MAKILALLAVCVVAAGAGRLARDAPANTNLLQELQEQAASFQKTFAEQFNALGNSKNQESFNKAIKEGSDSVLQQLSAFSTSLQGALSDANGKAKEALEQAKANVERTADELRRAHPEVEQQAQQLREKVQHAVQNTLQESQKLAKELAANAEQTNEKLAPKVKEAVDKLLQQAQEVQKKLHEAATKQ